jgi:hypothetical protein
MSDGLAANPIANPQQLATVTIYRKRASSCLWNKLPKTEIGKQDSTYHRRHTGLRHYPSPALASSFILARTRYSCDDENPAMGRRSCTPLRARVSAIRS